MLFHLEGRTIYIAIHTTVPAHRDRTLNEVSNEIQYQVDLLKHGNLHIVHNGVEQQLGITFQNFYVYPRVNLRIYPSLNLASNNSPSVNTNAHALYLDNNEPNILLPLHLCLLELLDMLKYQFHPW